MKINYPSLADLPLSELAEAHRQAAVQFEAMKSSDRDYDQVWRRMADCHLVYVRKWALEVGATDALETLLLRYPEEGPTIVDLTAGEAKQLALEYEAKTGNAHARRHAIAYRSLAARLFELGIV